MADITNVLNAIWPFLGVLNLLSVQSVSSVSADYCEFGLCDNDQYCCGNNKCCTKTLDLWFFWAGILLVIFALAVAAGVRYTKNRHATYVLLATHPVEEPEEKPVAFK